MENLIRLKIPTGWAVQYNKFIDELPIKSNEDESLDNWFNFTEDLLQISKLSNENGEYIIPKRHLLIDLGWYPDSSFYGEYTVSLVFVDPNSDNSWDSIDNFSSKDRFKIRDKIEKWLDQLILIDNNSETKDKILKILKK